MQGGQVDHSSHLPIPVATSSGEAEYISAATACMRASHLQMIILYDLRHLCTASYDEDKLNEKPARIIIDNEAVIYMSKYNMDTVGNIHVARHFHYVRQGTMLREYKFECIRSKFQ